MTDKQLKVLRELASEGYAVIVWTPKELGDIDPQYVEERSIEFGHQIIEDMKEHRP